ncbi:hypothetical protein ACQKO5_23230 [Novosphingobium subterraneum]
MVRPQSFEPRRDFALVLGDLDAIEADDGPDRNSGRSVTWTE